MLVQQSYPNLIDVLHLSIWKVFILYFKKIFRPIFLYLSSFKFCENLKGNGILNIKINVKSIKYWRIF